MDFIYSAFMKLDMLNKYYKLDKKVSIDHLTIVYKSISCYYCYLSTANIKVGDYFDYIFFISRMYMMKATMSKTIRIITKSKQDKA